MSTDADTIQASAVVDDRQVLQADLARVNLLRIRGDMSSSKTLCLSILKRFPESVDAHVMMGDLHAEQGELAPAAEWYSLALDLDRNAPGVQVKLSRARAALDISNQADRSRTMIMSGRRVSPWLYVAAIASILAVGSIAYIAGMKSPSEKAALTKAPISEKIVSPIPEATTPRQDFSDNAIRPPQSTTTTDLGPTPVNTNSVSEPKSTGSKDVPLTVSDDQHLLDQVSARTKYGKHVVSILADPRERSMILTYNVVNGEHGRYIGAILADIAMEYDIKTLSVTIRGVRNGILSYVADVPREKIMAVEAREKKDVQDLEDHDWIDEVLTNEFYKDKELMKTPSI